jgi:hypothetical protein
MAIRRITQDIFRSRWSKTLPERLPLITDLDNSGAGVSQ